MYDLYKYYAPFETNLELNEEFKMFKLKEWYFIKLIKFNLMISFFFKYKGFKKQNNSLFKKILINNNV